VERAPRPVGPAIDDDVKGTELEKSVVRELSTLRAEAAEQAAKHLVMTGRLLDEDPEAAYEHALAARKCGPRVAVIREAVGIAAYTSGRWTEALAELRTARRISGDDEHWPMMADCERALGRPEKALAMASAPEVKKLSKASLVEMRIVAAGARADLGQLDAAVVTLQTADLNIPDAVWAPRLRFAYAAALEAAGRVDEARQWYAKAAAVDPDGETDAAARLQELDGIRFFDEDDDSGDGTDAGLGQPGDGIDAELERPGGVSSPAVPAPELATTVPEPAAASALGDPAAEHAVGEPPAMARAAEESGGSTGAAAGDRAKTRAVGDPAVAPVASEPVTASGAEESAEHTAAGAGDGTETRNIDGPGGGSAFGRPGAVPAVGESSGDGLPAAPAAEESGGSTGAGAGDPAGTRAVGDRGGGSAFGDPGAAPVVGESSGDGLPAAPAAEESAGSTGAGAGDRDETLVAPAASSVESTSPFSERSVVESPHAGSAPSMPVGGLFLDAALPDRDTEQDEAEGPEA
jgi:tetratricopeptide (TPR) repeat protein